MTIAIEVREVRREFDVRKSFFLKRLKTVTAVDGISFSIQKGEIFGLLGPNGAGKTTTIKMMSTLLVPTSGSIKIHGLDVVNEAKQIRKFINVVYGGDRGLYLRLTGYENLRYFANLYGLDRRLVEERVRNALARVSLTDRANDKVEGYSRGMKQRLHIARSLLNDPEIIFLDEPTIGLDPRSARELREIVKELAGLGKTVLLTTHYMPEVEELCGRMAVINKGKLIALETPQGVKAKVQQQDLVTLRLENVEAKELLQLQVMYPQVELEGISESEMNVHVVLPQYLPFVSRLSELFKVTRVLDIRVRQQTLEDAYLSLLEEAR